MEGVTIIETSVLISLFKKLDKIESFIKELRTYKENISESL